MCKHDQAARTAIVSTHAHDAAATVSTTTWCHPPTVHHTTTSSSQHSAHPHSAPRTKAGLRPAEAEAGGRPADLPAGHPSTFHVTRLRCARLEPELSVIGTSWRPTSYRLPPREIIQAKSTDLRETRRRSRRERVVSEDSVSCAGKRMPTGRGAKPSACETRAGWERTQKKASSRSPKCTRRRAVSSR
eukprot:scaffold1116_cov103-Isochrysis_galbana.AAC.6